MKHVYIHFPLCLSRCTYCNFNVTLQSKNWREHFVDVINKTYKRSELSSPLSTLYVGGGTPSLLEEDEIESLLSIFVFDGSCERTLEMNPTEREKIPMFAKYFNRLSIGVQSLNDEMLRSFGRLHTSAEAIQCIGKATSSFENVSVDVLVSTPKKWSERNVKEELKMFVELGVTHVSVYELTVERGTRLEADVKRGILEMPEEDEKADQYEEVVETMESLGFDRYEVSSFAKSEKYESQHNHAYWNGSPYVGFGPGAHGRIKKDDGWYATIEQPSASIWAKMVPASMKKLSEEQRTKEIVSTALRTRLGALKHHVDVNECVQLISHGFLEEIDHGTRIRCTKKGMNVVDTLLERLI